MPTLLKNLTVEEIKDVLVSARTDIIMELGDLGIRMYCDEGMTVVETDRIHIYKTWNEMLKEPVFYGKTLEEVHNDLIVYW